VKDKKYILDEFLKDKVEDAHFAFKEAHWLNALSAINNQEDDEKKKGSFWIFSASLIGILFVALMGWLFVNNKSTNNKNNPSTDAIVYNNKVAPNNVEKNNKDKSIEHTNNELPISESNYPITSSNANSSIYTDAPLVGNSQSSQKPIVTANNNSNSNNFNNISNTSTNNINSNTNSNVTSAVLPEISNNAAAIQTDLNNNSTTQVLVNHLSPITTNDKPITTKNTLNSNSKNKVKSKSNNSTNTSNNAIIGNNSNATITNNFNANNVPTVSDLNNANNSNTSNPTKTNNKKVKYTNQNSNTNKLANANPLISKNSNENKNLAQSNKANNNTNKTNKENKGNDQVNAKPNNNLDYTSKTKIVKVNTKSKTNNGAEITDDNWLNPTKITIIQRAPASKVAVANSDELKRNEINNADIKVNTTAATPRLQKSKASAFTTAGIQYVALPNTTSTWASAPFMGFGYRLPLGYKLNLLGSANMAYVSGLNYNYTATSTQYGFGVTNNTYTLQHNALLQLMLPFTLEYKYNLKHALLAGMGATLNLQVVGTEKPFGTATTNSFVAFDNNYKFINPFVNFGYTYSINNSFSINAMYYQGLQNISNFNTNNFNSRLQCGIQYFLK
jgi:hypothetical protein